MTVEGIIFYLLIIDSLSANVLAFVGRGWYMHHFRIMSRLFPATPGWTLYYLVLVLWIGSLLWRMGMLGF